MNPYPTIGSSDTGALSDIPRTIVAKVEEQPIAAGTVIGGLVGHFLLKRKGAVGAIIGGAIGFLLGKSKG